MSFASRGLSVKHIKHLAALKSDKHGQTSTVSARCVARQAPCFFAQCALARLNHSTRRFAGPVDRAKGFK